MTIKNLIVEKHKFNVARSFKKGRNNRIIRKKCKMTKILSKYPNQMLKN
jgi:hypothetical protein